MKDDCFALPPGVNWMPVDDALAHLKSRLGPVVGTEEISVPDAAGRVLAKDQMALRSNPPGANSAVDGYGFAHASTTDGPQVLPLVDGRAAAGEPFEGVVPAGHAIRILTGALIPEGVDTVVMQEDVNVKGGHVAFQGPVKPNANTRKAGEDVEAGQLALSAGHKLRSPDLALLTGLGVASVTVYKRLRVGVLSTGDEIVPADGGASPKGKTYDANRPMLLALATEWGHEAVDLGHVFDDRALLKSCLDQARENVDVILTSGGASAGDEDHVSALLKEEGALEAWRIALKPGRPLALGMWHGVPVFGLPGNPVAAFVTASIFARPSLSALSGAGWVTPQGFMVPAAFSKSKKPGRREYLRARMGVDGRVEVFKSEGSGRISGLAWANGLVELPDGALTVNEGDMVRFLPYGSLGIPD
ncbi:MAG TPA: molybdopterin molybdenumtransferase MoeA [Rhodobacteraceae bacterium]|nr:molybdopterin molybdenumtransferase MoeA [Paracoccaceae bacterium]